MGRQELWGVEKVKLSKIQREQLKMKYGGLCSYCGHPLSDRWHADHFIPVERNAWGNGKGIMQKPENDTLENMMPSCPPCNISKHSLSIEQWRDWLSGHMRSLNEHHSIYRLMRSYGLIIETGNPITFYFERLSEADKNCKEWKSD